MQGTPISIPDSGQSPNWSAGVIEAFQAIAAALAQFTGAFDVPPQVFTLTSNVNTNIDLPNLAFPTSVVRGAEISYTVFRTTSTTTVAEEGSLQVIYNPDNSIGNKWEISRDYTGDAKVTFNITDVGQIQFSSALIAGINHEGTISFQAKAILQT